MSQYRHMQLHNALIGRGYKPKPQVQIAAFTAQSHDQSTRQEGCDLKTFILGLQG